MPMRSCPKEKGVFDSRRHAARVVEHHGVGDDIRGCAVHEDDRGVEILLQLDVGMMVRRRHEGSS
jgi:hypothetical protein